MKIYTEEQVREALNAGFRLAMETDGGLNDYRELFINALTPIKLPSDDEIQDESEKYYDNNAAKAHDYYFELGAKWMRDKILQGGNK